MEGQYKQFQYGAREVDEPANSSIKTREINNITHIINLIRDEIETLDKSSECLVQIINPILAPDTTSHSTVNDMQMREDTSELLKELLSVLSRLQSISFKINKTTSRVQL